MSEPKLISPMLDDFQMGGPISDHHGVRCCPAMRKNSDDKYIVKIISVPESQTKLDALLLTGAFSDAQSALVYFEELANGIVDEKKIIDSLSQLEGFVSFEDCQIVPMEDAVGYEVYLLSEYRRTLERLNAKTPMTLLGAVNLGLDLCSALSVCRRSGYLFVDLKPSNIYIVGDKEFRIGDLGFVRLNSLKYESLPDKYRSCYTAPELEDLFAPLNDTIDIYSLGLILYQVFNGGVLPFEGQQAPNQKFEAPAFADPEMSEIILKACDPDPAERWQDPAQMGQAIVAYMQKNGVNDTLLAAQTESVPEDVSVETDLDLEIETDNDETVVVASDEVELVEVTSSDNTAPALSDVNDPVSEVELDDDRSAEQVSDETVDEDLAVASVVDVESVMESEDISENKSDNDASENTAEESEGSTEEYVNLSIFDDFDEAEQILANVGEDYDGISDDVSEMLGQIDDLTAHDVPAPVVAPDPIEIKIPEPILPETDPDSATELQDPVEYLTSDAAGEMVTSEVTTPEESVSEDEEISEDDMPYVPKKKRKGLVWIIVIALILGLAAGGYYFYSNYYLQPIHAISLEGSEDNLQVILNAEIDEAILTVVCADSHGNKVTAPVVGGKAAFSGLAPDTAYTISVEVDGFHKLIGTTSKVYSSPVQTKIMQMQAITGSESGSVIISFAVDGPNSEQWNVIYNADGEAERVVEFSDHMVTLTGLTVGKEYAFHLEPVSDIYISGETDLTYVAKDLICAENLRVSSFLNGALTVQWDIPEGKTVEQWSVRCYNDAGYNETVFTEENIITFQNLDETLAYSIEVTAADMSVNQRVSVGANTVTFSNFTASSTATGMVSLSWEANREVPVNGWQIQYRVNETSIPEAVMAAENSAQVPLIPGCSYTFDIYDNAGNAVLGGPFTFNHSDSSTFDAYGINKSNITARLCKTPSETDWSYEDLTDEDYLNAFTVPANISIVLACDGDVGASEDQVLIVYSVYNEENELIAFTHASETWDNLWNKNYCELDIPVVPDEAGTYNVIVYFNGSEVGSQKFEISA